MLSVLIIVSFCPVSSESRLAVLVDGEHSGQERDELAVLLGNLSTTIAKRNAAGREKAGWEGVAYHMQHSFEVLLLESGDGGSGWR